MNVRQPLIVTDGGPWAEHDQACAVCQQRHAILNLSTAVFEPCGECLMDGWRLQRSRFPRARRAARRVIGAF